MASSPCFTLLNSMHCLCLVDSGLLPYLSCKLLQDSQEWKRIAKLSTEQGHLRQAIYCYKNVSKLRRTCYICWALVACHLGVHFCRPSIMTKVTLMPSGTKLCYMTQLENPERQVTCFGTTVDLLQVCLQSICAKGLCRVFATCSIHAAAFWCRGTVWACLCRRVQGALCSSC